jgi:hypothetical protein
MTVRLRPDPTVWKLLVCHPTADRDKSISIRVSRVCSFVADITIL